jgi:cell division protein FtsZ
MGIGVAGGESRAQDAARGAISSPLLETSVEGARGVLLNITGGPELTLFEVNDAAEIISQAVDPEANIIFGAVIDESMGDRVRVTVIATGFPGQDGRGPSVSRHASATRQGDIELRSFTPNDLDIPEFLRRK